MEHVATDRRGPSGSVLGREAELDAIGRALAPRELPAMVVLDGEPGIGKTTLWAAAVADARRSGVCTLTASPTEAEGKLDHAVLGDLLHGRLEVALPDLPDPQRRALQVALLLADAGDAPPDEGTVAAGFVTCLRRLAGDGPVLVAVDDVQWCDAASARVLTFAARRMLDEPIGLLVARRRSAPAPLPLGLDRPRPGARVHAFQLGPLSVGALHHMLRRRLGAGYPLPVVRRIHDTCGGNPFFALEIGRALEQASEPVGPGPLPVPTDLHALVAGRLAGLPARTQELLPVVAALADPRVPLIDRAAGADGIAALDPAFAAGILRMDGGRLRFTHPLLAGAAYASIGPGARRRLHRRLAGVVEDPEERAHHLAVATEAPDKEVAAIVEDAARRAVGRGAIAAGARFFGEARRLTPAGDAAAHDLAIAEAGCWIDAGENTRARALLSALLEESAPGRRRAAALMELGRAFTQGVDWEAATLHLEQALAEGGADLEIRLFTLRYITMVSALRCDDVAATLAHARRMAEAAEEAGHDAFLGLALAKQAKMEVLLGRPFPARTIERALALEPAAQSLSPMERPSDYLATVDLWTDRLPEALATLEGVARGVAERGEETAVVWTTGRISHILWLMGDWAGARERALTAYESAVQSGQLANQAVMASTIALVDATQGLEEDARARAAEALRIAEGGGALLAQRNALAALGLLELAAGRCRQAHEHLGPLIEEVRSAGFGEPGAMRFVPDDVEALIAFDADAAAQLLEWYEGLALRVGRRSALGAAWRCRGLLAAAEGDHAGAAKVLARAAEQLAPLPLPFERARTLLALGASQRRAKQKRAARESLAAAAAELERLEAQQWRDRATAELGSVGGRAGSGDQLTPTERRIAQLVASGRSNRDVAAALYLSPKTVEFHLHNVFRKLDVRSRTQLAAQIAEQGVADAKPGDFPVSGRSGPP